jgi:hypothetical protein
MRTKKRPALATPDLKSAWAKYYASTKEDKLSAYEAKGWKTISTMATETNQSPNTVQSQMRNLTSQNIFDKKIIRSMSANGVRDVAIFRPASQRRANSNAKP